ncbi:MAG TPA: hypothetical protein VFS43_34535 [Polyangiaceae bacterium]|nr:hypothetical protein [Polyangiaceae bacterium]
MTGQAPTDEPTSPTDDVDLVLRHVSRRFPEQFARALLPPGSRVASASWLDTQVTARQRRLDRALDVRTAAGGRRLLHTEWQLRFEADLPFRVYEYHALLALSLHDELEAAKASARPPRPPGAALAPPRIESTVVLLSGREEPWPAWGEYRTSPEGAPFSGVRFRIEAVYQRRVAELEAKGSPLWMIFAPLAVDATPARMAQVVEALRRRSSPRDFDELALAMTVLADADRRRRPGLQQAIVAHLPRELVMQNWIYKQGLAKGIEQGIEQGIERGIERGLRLFERVLERRLGRPLSEAERGALARRFQTLGPDRLGDVATELSGEALAAWLNDADAR